MSSKMPKIETLRKHFPDCNLTDDKLLEISEWLRKDLRQEFITPTNKLLGVLIKWEESKTECVEK